MNRIRMFAIGVVWMLALTPLTQKAAVAQDKMAAVHVPSAEEQMQLFKVRLELTAEQQEKIKPVLAELEYATQKLVEDKSLSHEEQMKYLWSWRMGTDRAMRAMLNEEQKKKLDQVEQEPHPELHGDLNG